MYSVSAHELVALSFSMGITRGYVTAMGKQFPLSRERIAEASVAFGEFKVALQKMELLVSSAFADMLGSQASAGCNYETLVKSYEQLLKTLELELKQRYVFGLTTSESALYNSTEPLFGKEVNDKFNSAIFDIDEAGKCLALGRSTASVFHLMRVVETAIRAVHECLGINVALVGNDKNWGSVLNRIRENYKARKKFAENDLFQELYASLDAVKDAWRNGTMHIEKKYTQEEAVNIYLATCALMKRIAARMDENGVPQAKE